MVSRKFCVVVCIASLAGGIIGCSSGPKAPTPTEAAIAAQKVNQGQQQQVQAIQSDPNLSDAQKASKIGALNQDVAGPNFGRGAHGNH